MEGHQVVRTHTERTGPCGRVRMFLAHLEPRLMAEHLERAGMESSINRTSIDVLLKHYDMFIEGTRQDSA